MNKYINEKKKKIELIDNQFLIIQLIQSTYMITTFTWCFALRLCINKCCYSQSLIPRDLDTKLLNVLAGYTIRYGWMRCLRLCGGRDDHVARSLVLHIVYTNTNTWWVVSVLVHSIALLMGWWLGLGVQSREHGLLRERINRSFVYSSWVHMYLFYMYISSSHTHIYINIINM